MSWSAGFGCGIITPDVPVMLAGFSERQHPAERVHDELQARALYLSDGTRAVCLIVCDLLGMSAEYAEPVRKAIASKLGLDSAAVLTAATHTHAGPSALSGTAALGWPEPEGYVDILVRGCLAAAVKAEASVAPAELFYGRAPLPADVSYNRRGHPYDPWFAVLDVRDASGARIGTLANIGVHPVVLGSGWLEVSADWVGFFRTELERTAGGTTVMLSGALGDVNPVERHTDVEIHLAEAVEEAEAIGRALAEAVHHALGAARPVDGALTYTSRAIDVAAGGTPLSQLLSPGGRIAVEFVNWSIGSVPLVTAPGEAFHALGNAIAEAHGGNVLIAGLSPAWNGYLPMPYGEGYEEMVSFGPDAVAAISAAMTKGS
ncbi:MAG: neutral/alkaline non-lysosomal ceramidase N-terminal domain-containing protein [Actinomycetota bacterium]